MKTTFNLIAAALLLGMTACTNEEFVESPVQNEGGKVISLTLNANRGDATTRSDVSYNSEYGSLESAWKAGDVIYVYSIKSGAKLGTLAIDGDVTNQKASDAAQWKTSYATFKGTITLGTGDAITDKLAFVYQGDGRSLTADAEGLLTYDIEAKEDVADLNVFDVAYATGQLQGTAAEAYLAVSFSNKLAFGYFSTETFAAGNLNTDYYNQFTLDVKTGTLKGVGTGAVVPGNKTFYMPLIPGTINIQLDKAWSKVGDDYGYSGGALSKTFTAAAGTYYRLSKNNATDPLGPVAFESTTWKKYNTLADSKFNVSATTQVYFTQGNLQYIGSAATPYWRVADSQYDYLGTSNGKPANADSGATIDANTDVDLFGWGEVEPPFLGSNVNADYQPDITTGNVDLTTDWATKFNGTAKLYASDSNVEYKDAAKKGGNYCVLTKAEWQYLFANQYWGFATVTLTNGSTVNGLVICPNTVTTEEQAKTFLTGTVYKSSATQSGKTGAYSENSITQATIDENGLLFLPAAGNRSGLSISNVGSRGYYWSTTSSSATDAYSVNFNATYFYSAVSSRRYYGFSVRLASVVSE